MRVVPLGELVGAARATASRPSADGDLASYIARGVGREPSKPFITWYDDRTGERVELSYATFANWVWKSANYLTDGLDVQPGDVVAVVLPAHWQTVAIWYAAWAAGAIVDASGVDALPHSEAVAVFAHEAVLDAVVASGVARGAVVGLSLRPMAARLKEPPSGVADYATEVPVFGDAFRPTSRTPLTAAALPGVTGDELLARAAAAAAHLQLSPQDRVLCTADVSDPDAFAATVLAVFDAGAGLVLSPDPDAGRLERRAADERVTVHVTATAPA